MLAKNLTNSEIEDIYDALAVAIDNVEQENESILLTKLALVLSNMLADKKQVLEAIRIAGTDL